MIVCFRCTAETKAHLDTLLATGAYKTYDEAITAAVRNQVLMEQEVTEKGAIIIGAPAAAPSPPAPQVPSNGQVEAKLAAKRTGNGPPAKKVPASPRRAETPALEVPALFRLEGFPQEAPRGLADLPPDMWSHGQKIPLDRWVLGQFNRLLPAKVNARALVRLFLDSPKGLDIAEATTVAGQAAVLGDFLRHIDARHEVSRDDLLSTAFPTAGEDSEKSRTRYANQFVVYQNTKGELSGLMIDLKLINVLLHRKERRIVPTRVAWEFAAMRNPLLDGGQEGPPEKFSPQERSFLLGHIVRSVPVEAFAYRVILEAVQQGQTSPEQIDVAMKKYLNEDRAGDLSQSFLASQRSGAVSRMSDLGLIERRREGVRVFYAATEGGLAFLSECATNQPR
jgi:hypothetical protein